MPIDSVNTAMNPLQFAQARSRTRTVETTVASSRKQGGARLVASSSAIPASSAPSTPERLIAPATLHFTYLPIPGKPAAKRRPQLADSVYWSFSLDRLA